MPLLTKGISTTHYPQCKQMCSGQKAWEGGYISGHHEIKEYWTRQWTEINPKVEPIGFIERENGSLEVKVHQNVKDLKDNLMFDGMVKHIYTFQDGLIKTMDIELVENN